MACKAHGLLFPYLLCDDIQPPSIQQTVTHMLTQMAQKRCCGITRAGKPCSIDTASKLTDFNGRLVAEPLRCGGRYCMFHAKPFVTRPAQNDRHCIVIFLDLESTGVDIFEDRVVEIAAVHAPQDPWLFGGSFSTAVDLDSSIAQISVLMKPSQCNAKGSFCNLCPNLGTSNVHVCAAQTQAC